MLAVVEEVIYLNVLVVGERVEALEGTDCTAMSVEYVEDDHMMEAHYIVAVEAVFVVEAHYIAVFVVEATYFYSYFVVIVPFSSFVCSYTLHKLYFLPSSVPDTRQDRFHPLGQEEA